MSRLFTTNLFIVTTLVAATACANGNTSTGPAPSDHVLIQIDPTPIPYVIYDGPFYDKHTDHGGQSRLNWRSLKGRAP